MVCTVISALSGKVSHWSDFTELKNWDQRSSHKKVLLNSFHLNGHTLGFDLDLKVRTTRVHKLPTLQKHYKFVVDMDSSQTLY